MTAFKRDDIRWLNMLLAGGLVTINLIAFGAAYWLATRDIMSEFTGEVRIGSNGAPRVGGVREAGGRSHKRSSLSKKGDPIAVEETSNVSLPLPPPRLSSPKPTVTTPPAAPRHLAEAPMASPNTAPLPEPEIQEQPRPARHASGAAEPPPKAESP